MAFATVYNTIFEQTAGSYLPFLNTPNTALDMIRIIEAHGRDKLNLYGIS